VRFLADENIHAAESLAGNADEVLREIARVSAPRA
jgi:hypothetical protein